MELCWALSGWGCAKPCPHPTPSWLPQTPLQSPSILFSPLLARGGAKSSSPRCCHPFFSWITPPEVTFPPRGGGDTVQARSCVLEPPTSSSVPGIAAAGPPKFLPVLVDPLVRHWRGQRTRLPPSRAPQRHVPSHPVPTSSNIGDFFSPFSRIFRFPTPRVPLQPRVTPQVSPHLSPARTGQPACRVSPSPSPFLRRFHQKRAAFCGAERGHGFGTPQQPWGWVSAPQNTHGSSRVKDQRPKTV